MSTIALHFSGSESFTVEVKIEACNVVLLSVTDVALIRNGQIYWCFFCFLPSVAVHSRGHMATHLLVFYRDDCVDADLRVSTWCPF